MTTEQKAEGTEKAPEVKDWRSERERNGWCRCGVRQELPSPGCGWHNGATS